MGLVKRWMEEQEDRGFSSVGNKFVCSQCIDEPDIRLYIKTNGDSEACSYCERAKVSTLHFDKFMEFFMECMNDEYGYPDNEGVPWEGGWLGDVFDSYDLLDQIGLSIESECLQQDISDSISDRQWCKKGFYQLDPSEVLLHGWNEFVSVVKHKSRFVFYRVNEQENLRGYEEIPPNAFLDALCGVISDLNMYETIPAEKQLVRVRIHSRKEVIVKATEIGPPDREYAVYPSRMSPAGIPMFYGAFDKKTAIAETYSEKEYEQIATVGTFRSTRSLNMVDLTKLPKYPGLFSGHDRKYRHNVYFINSFLEDFTASVSKDGKEHIDYVPTQVVSEHIRYIHVDNNDNKIDGIIYPSSKNPKEKAVVLFCENSHCVDKDNITTESLLVLQKLQQVNPKKHL